MNSEQINQITGGLIIKFDDFLKMKAGDRIPFPHDITTIARHITPSGAEIEVKTTQQITLKGDNQTPKLFLSSSIILLKEPKVPQVVAKPSPVPAVAPVISKAAPQQPQPKDTHFLNVALPPVASSPSKGTHFLNGVQVHPPVATSHLKENDDPASPESEAVMLAAMSQDRFKAVATTTPAVGTKRKDKEPEDEEETTSSQGKKQKTISLSKKK